MMTHHHLNERHNRDLRGAARDSMKNALKLLDLLGDELPAAATLQHAIDRLSDQNSAGVIE